MKLLLSIGLAAACWTPLIAQSGPASHCLPPMEFEPALAEHPQKSVTFNCEAATPLDLIRAIGFQTRMPIGLVLGDDQEVLSRTKRAYNLHAVRASIALAAAVEGTGYSIVPENGVTILLAPDLSSRRQELLDHTFTGFDPAPNQTMVELAMMLTSWLQAFVDPNLGSGGSILGSLNDERINLRLGRRPSTEEIANEIVTQGSGGMWTLQTGVSLTPPTSTVNFSIEPYQHYTNIVREANLAH
jgi:hypothetical protein